MTSLFKGVVTLKKAIVFLMMSFFLIGCWDREEINDVAFVVGTAIDKKEDQYMVSIQIPLVGEMGGQSGGGGGTTGDKTWFIDSATGETIREANERKQSALSRNINFSHRRIVVIGEDLAKDGLMPAFDILARGQQNRLTAFIVIADGLGRDVLNADAPIEQYPSEMLRELTIGATTKPIFLKTFMYHFVEEGLDAYAPVVKLVETEPGDKGEAQTNIQIDGLAILKKDKLVELLEPEKAKYVLLTMNQANLPTFKIDAPDHTGKLMIQLQEYETNLSPSINEEEVTMEINIRAKGALVENMSTFSMRNYENKKKVEQHLEEKLKTDVKQTIHHLQSLGSDPIGFGQLLRRNKVNEWMKLKGQWENVYPKIEIKVDARVHIEHEGVLSKPLENKEHDS
ncbi:hypothetical protein BTR23_09125 [Alkalihalophilus pseudofirmus]|nr:hypothetical protein BTR23_09125 [Alkalihalophilus pseudofirmus]